MSDAFHTVEGRLAFALRHADCGHVDVDVRFVREADLILDGKGMALRVRTPNLMTPQLAEFASAHRDASTVSASPAAAVAALNRAITAEILRVGHANCKSAQVVAQQKQELGAGSNGSTTNNRLVPAHYNHAVRHDGQVGAAVGGAP